MGRKGWLVAAVVAAVLTACAEEPQRPASSPSVVPRIGPLTPRDPTRMSREQTAAIIRLADEASHDPPAPGAMDMSGGAETTVPLVSIDQARFDEQWAAAQSAVTRLNTPAKARAAGYTPAAVQIAGIGVHWVDWTLIDKPFDPAHPAMLLFDQRVEPPRLVGFSYWIHARAPDGFAGDNDVWHQHTNLCIVNGWVDREMAATPADCAGSFLAGSDLWMLHAWVVPGHENRWGPFAVDNPALCPREVGTPDIARCLPG
jgi:hypothetical protein